MSYLIHHECLSKAKWGRWFDKEAIKYVYYGSLAVEQIELILFYRMGVILRTTFKSSDSFHRSIEFNRKLILQDYIISV